MNLIVLLFALMLYVAVVSGRNLQDSNQESEDNDNGQEEKHVHENTNSQTRHRRRPRQSYYNHLNPYNPYDDYFGRREDKRGYNRQQEDKLARILDLLEELSSHLRKAQTPSPPQIIYYPIPYPIPQCQNQGSVPQLPNRIKPGEIDKNQNWGIIPGDLGLDDFNGLDGSRPINFDPVKPEGPTVKPPPVDHGSSQAGLTTPRPAITEPGKCKAAILVCCQDTSEAEKRDCFTNYGCVKTYSLANSCHPRVLKHIIAEFAEAYAPINAAY